MEKSHFRIWPPPGRPIGSLPPVVVLLEGVPHQVSLLKGVAPLQTLAHILDLCGSQENEKMTYDKKRA